MSEEIRKTAETILGLPDGDDEACLQVTWDVGDPGLLGIEDIGVDDLKALARAYLDAADSKERIHRRAQQAESANKRMRDNLLSLASLSRFPERRLPSDLVRSVCERALGGTGVTVAGVAELDERQRRLEN